MNYLSYGRKMQYLSYGRKYKVGDYVRYIPMNKVGKITSFYANNTGYIIKFAKEFYEWIIEEDKELRLATEDEMMAELI